MLRRVFRFTTTWSALVLIHASIGASQPRGPVSPVAKTELNDRILIFDMSPAPDAAPNIVNRIFSFDGSSSSNLVISLRKSLERCIVACYADAVIDSIRRVSDELADLSSTRWLSAQGDTFDIFVFGPLDRMPKLDIKEDARQSRLEIDVGTLIQVANKIGARADRPPGAPVPKVRFTHRRYFLTKSRATLKVVATLRPPQAQRANANEQPQEAQVQEDAPEKLETTLVTGSGEHFFLSANAAFTQARQVTYDEESKTLQPDKKPEEFLIGVNYSVDDLFANDEASGLRSFIGGLYAGLLLEASKTPFSQIAATVGLRRNLPYLENFLTFTTVSPYVGLVWVRNDRVESGATSAHVKHTYAKPRFIVGLSLNLDKAVGWLTPAKTATTSTAEAGK